MWYGWDASVSNNRRRSDGQCARHSGTMKLADDEHAGRTERHQKPGPHFANKTGRRQDQKCRTMSSIVNHLRSEPIPSPLVSRMPAACERPACNPALGDPTACPAAAAAAAAPTHHLLPCERKEFAVSLGLSRSFDDNTFSSSRSWFGGLQRNTLFPNLLLAHLHLEPLELGTTRKQKE
ncbi:hypothetical protein BCV70DRAFT_42632 [Testicularia cyperi]|uniref:Uncharacterized protein n=1 Tax=Testicularia cyperi TaxID=1882483 RepID=A0A317XK98_9BASI|nr:hypothetical protein BCV70DRAFT_42632 [Testicularia cyperi]